MHVVTSPVEIKDIVNEERGAGRVVGLVPTMGFFHEGHLSLMRAARRECGFVVVSLFVNPTQFGPHEDLEDYPRDLERDKSMADETGADCIFYPSVEDMYPEPYRTYIEVEKAGEVLCGAARPGHFRGVGTVVAKLFNIIPARRAYFGLKDAQQVWVIRKMVDDLNFDVEIVACPTVREDDGLAMSSRNIYLGAEERKAACVLYRSLRWAEEQAGKGERDAATIVEGIKGLVAEEPLVRAEYVEAVDWGRLEAVKKLKGEVLIAIAARVGRARLIDNVLLNVRG
jgi:pantoate--beta-alanine ligase